MRSNTKSSVTLPREEFRLVRALKTQLRLKSNVEVVRRALKLLQETTDRKTLKAAYRKASLATRASSLRAREATTGIEPLRVRRRPGLLRGRLVISKDFDAPV